MQYTRTVGMTWDVADDRAVILDADGSTLITLNPIATLLWQHLEDPVQVDDMVRILVEQFPEVDPAQLADDVDAFVDEMIGEGLLEPSQAS